MLDINTDRIEYSHFNPTKIPIVLLCVSIILTVLSTLPLAASSKKPGKPVTSNQTKKKKIIPKLPAEKALSIPSPTNSQAAVPLEKKTDIVAKDTNVPISGFIAPEMIGFEKAVLDIMKTHHIPSALLAVGVGKKLCLSRAYGYLDPAKTKPLTVNAQGRIASLDKPVTATAIMQFGNQGWRVQQTGEVVTFDSKPFKILYDAGLRPIAGARIDRRIFDVTFRQLAYHKGGIGAQPTPEEMQKDLGLAALPEPINMLRWYMSQPLIFDPGSEPPAGRDYCSAGYDIMRFFIAWMTGDYLGYLKQYVFGPSGNAEIGITKTKPKDRSPQEMFYYTKFKARSVFPEDKGREIPVTDGGGKNVDKCLMMTASAQALVGYLSIWYLGYDSLLTDDKGNLAPKLDNGMGVAAGSFAGIWTVMIQRRHRLSCAVLIFNKSEETEGTQGTDIGIPLVRAFEALDL